MGIVAGIVSLWLARADSEDSLDNFTTITYTEDGDYINSTFGEYFKIGYYDEDFKESVFLDKHSNYLNDLLASFSYDEIIIPRFIELIPSLQDSFNSVIMIYNYLYDGEAQEVNIDSINCKFFGHVNYI
jgi:Immunity protein 22